MLGLLTLVFALIGALSSLYVSYRLLDLYKLTDDVSYALVSVAFVLFAAALFFEAFVETSPPHFPGHGPRWCYCHHRPYQGLAQYAHLAVLPYPLYLIAYSLYFVASLVSKKLYAMFPLVLAMIGEMNFIILALLIVSFFISFENKNRAFVAFYGTLALSHALDALVVLHPPLAPSLFSTALLLRSLAPIALLCFARCKA